MTDGASSVGVFTTDRDLVVRSWDPWLAEATGVPAARACGVALVELFPDVAERGFVPRLRRVAEHGTVEVLAPAFHRFLVPCAPRQPSAHFDRMQQHVTISPLRAGGDITGIVVTIEDVTPRLERARVLAAELESQDEAIRLRAARTLADEDAPASALAGALGDTSWRVRRAAAKGIAGGGEEAVAALVEAIRERHRDPAVLNAAIAALAESARDVVPAVVALLRSTDADVRTYAALALGQIGDGRALPPLLDALADADVNVRYHAIEALGRIGGRGAADAVATIAASRDFYLAFPALDALAAIGEPSVAPRLLPLLDDDLLQAAAAEALGKLGSEDVVLPLAHLLARPGAAVPSIACALATLYDRVETGYGEGELVADLARGAIDAEGARQLLAALPAATDAELAGIVRVLGWLDVDGVDRALARMLAHPEARPTTTEALASRGARAVDALVDALASDDEQVRRAAAAALGRIASRRAVPALVSLVNDVPDVAIVAIGALGAIGDPAAFEPLVDLLDHEGAAVRQAAVAALNSLGHPELPRRTVLLLGSSSPRVRESAARIAGYFGYLDCLEPLIALTRDPDEAVRRVAVEQLGFLDDVRVAPVLHAVLRDETPQIRAAAARALAQLPSAEAVSPLLLALGDSDLWVRYYAARSAAPHRDARLGATLERLAASDPAPPVRIAAINALAEHGATSAVPVITELSADDDDELASAALAALGKLGTPSRPLVAALESPNPERRLAALGALADVRDAGAVAAVERVARTDFDPRVRDAAVDVLGRIASEGAVAALLSLLTEPRRVPAATAALTRMGEEHVAWVARGLGDPDVGARCAVVEALARMKHHSASRRLVAALEDPAAAVRLAATQALGRLDLRDAEQKLSALARTDENPAVRQAAHSALAR